MKDSQLDKMSLKDLIDLRERLDHAIEARQEEEMVALKERLASMATDAGFSIGELFPNASKGRGRSKASSSGSLYRNPEDPTQTWSGRGRKPKWLSGESDIERFRVR